MGKKKKGDFWHAGYILFADLTGIYTAICFVLILWNELTAPYPLD